MKTPCQRCDWQPDPDSPLTTDAQLTEHAEAFAHPLCCICHRSLTDVQPQTCDSCLDQAQAHLSGVLTMWLELRSYLGHLHGSSYDTSHGTDDYVLPGGDVLVLLGPGSQGLSDNHETIKSNDDALSIAHLLGSWQALWQQARNEHIDPAEHLVHQGRGGVIYSAAGYLERHSRWAANRLPTFPNYAADLEALHALLEIKTGRTRAPAKANAACFTCEGTIIWPVDRGTGLELPTLTCRDCRQSYTLGQYLLALRAKRESDLTGWVPIADAARAAHRSSKTIRAWIGRGLIDAWRYCKACEAHLPTGPMTAAEAEHVANHTYLVWWPSVDAQTRQAEHRAPRTRASTQPPKPTYHQQLLERLNAYRKASA